MDPKRDDMKDIECPVCLEYMKPPILQCENGHGTCIACRTRTKECPLCKGKFTDNRKYDAENLSRKSEHPCKFRAAGCTQMNLLAWKKAHELQCIYRHRQCPFSACRVQMDRKDVKDHMLKDHKSMVREGPLNSTQQFTVHDVGLLVEQKWTNKRDVFERFMYRNKDAVFVEFSYKGSNVTEAWVAGDDVFIVKFLEESESKPERCCICCAYVGSPEEARKYKYKVTFNSLNKYLITSYTAQCHSYLEKFQENGKGMNSDDTWVHLPNTHVSECREEGGFMNYELKISKIE